MIIQLINAAALAYLIIMLIRINNELKIIKKELTEISRKQHGGMGSTPWSPTETELERIYKNKL